MRNPWMIGTLMAACLMAVCNASTRPPAHLEKIVMKLASDPIAPDVPEAASLLGISVGKPTFTDSWDDIYGLDTFHYAATSNPWGITAIEHTFTPDASGLREGRTTIELLFDGSYCLRPTDFPKGFGLTFEKIYMPSPHGTAPGSYLLDFKTTTSDFRNVSVASSDVHACATRVSIDDWHGERTDKRIDGLLPRHDGPFIASTPWTNELASGWTVHPPFSTDIFLQKTMALVLAHEGYITPDELNAAFDLHAPQPMPGKGNKYDLKAYVDWYMHLQYLIAPATFKSFQPSIYPEGEGSSLRLDFHTYTFRAPSGELQCLATEAVTDELARNGWALSPKETWTPDNPDYFPRTETVVYRKGNAGSNIRVSSLVRSARSCVTGLLISGAKVTGSNPQPVL